CEVVYVYLLLFFFFQAEDGIRDRNVTGVQTCALPISTYSGAAPRKPGTTGTTPRARSGRSTWRALRSVRARSGDALPKVPSVWITAAASTYVAGHPAQSSAAATMRADSCSPRATR